MINHITGRILAIQEALALGLEKNPHREELMESFKYAKMQTLKKGLIEAIAKYPEAEILLFFESDAEDNSYYLMEGLGIGEVTTYNGRLVFKEEFDEEVYKALNRLNKYWSAEDIEKKVAEIEAITVFKQAIILYM